MPERPTILLDPSPRRTAEIFGNDDLSRLSSLGEVVWVRDEPMPRSEFERYKDELDVIVTGSWRYPSPAEIPRLRAVMEVSGRHPTAVQFDYGSAFARNIRVLSCAPAFAPQVAEMGLAMALDAAREIAVGDAAFKAGRERYLAEGNRTTFTLFGKTIGFVGYGNLARYLQRLVAPFRCTLQAYDPWLPASFIEDNDVAPVDLPTLMGTSDVVFVLAVVSKENRHMIDRTLLESMKRGAVFALLSRAHVVDFDALTDVLHDRRIKAAIDVFPAEPLSADHPIRRAPNTVLSAHRAGSVTEDLLLIGRMVADDLEAIIAGVPPRRLQNAEPEIVGRL